MIKDRIEAASRTLSTGIFLLFLVLPALDTAFRLDQTPPPIEKRDLAALPPFPNSIAAIHGFSSRFDDYIADNFGFRNMLVRFRGIMALSWLGVPPSVKVLLGKHGWLFYAGADSVSYMEGRQPFFQEELETWKRVLTQRNRWLSDRGIRYLVVFAPEKFSIYPEHLPDWIHPIQKGTRLDQILLAMRDYPEVEILDLRETLLQAKKHTLVYQPTDTHWNALGAHVAYINIMCRLEKWFPQTMRVPLSDFEVSWERDSGGDLAVMLNVQGLFSDPMPLLAPKALRNVQTGIGRDYLALRNWTSQRVPLVTECAHGEIPRAVMFRDSFAIALIPYLSMHFGRAVYVWLGSSFEPVVIEKEHPSIVIQEFTERSLSGSPTTNNKIY